MLLLGPDVHGATIGIVGFGRIGQAVARRARGFGMEVLYHDLQPLPRGRDRTARRRPTARSTSCWRACDFVSIHVNLSEETRGLISAETLAVDEADGRAGQHVPRSGRRPGGPVPTRCATASSARPRLDVTDPEPIPMDDPLVGLDNCLIVPHIASAIAGDPRQDGGAWPRPTCWPASAASRCPHRSPHPADRGPGGRIWRIRSG